MSNVCMFYFVHFIDGKHEQVTKQPTTTPKPNKEGPTFIQRRGID